MEDAHGEEMCGLAGENTGSRIGSRSVACLVAEMLFALLIWINKYMDVKYCPRGGQLAGGRVL